MGAMTAMRGRFVRLALVAGFLLVGCELDVPTDSTVPTDSILSDDAYPESSDTTWVFKDPPAPNSGGSPLPDPTTDPDPDEIDCDNAEDLCDSGAFACDDIADYCDIGPADGSDLPDDYDWDE